MKKFVILIALLTGLSSFSYAAPNPDVKSGEETKANSQNSLNEKKTDKKEDKKYEKNKKPEFKFDINDKSSAVAIGVISADKNANTSVLNNMDKSIAVGIIGISGEDEKKGDMSVAVTKLDVKSWKKDYIVLNYKVSSNAPSLISSKSKIKICKKGSSKVLSVANVEISSKKETENLERTVTMWVGDSSLADIYIESSSVSCTDEKSYEMVPFKSFTAVR